MKSTKKLTCRFIIALRDSPKGPNQWSEKAAHEIAEGLKFSDADFKSVMDYAFHGKLIEVSKKTDGSLRIRLGQNADEWLSNEKKADQKPKDGWNHKIIPGIVIGIVLLIVGAAFRYYFPQFFPK